MLKQSPSKNLRSKGFKVKNVLQICVLLVICIWFLHQFKHSYDEKKAFEEDNATFSEVQSELESIKLGRKDLHIQMQHSALEKDRHREGELRTSFGEVVENKPEESGDEGRGGGDDEIDGHDQEKSEDEEADEVEDLIDEDDRERDDGSEEQDSEETGNQIEDENLSVNEAQYDGERNSEAGEESYKVDDASRALMQDNHAMSTGFSVSGLRKLMEEQVEYAESIQLEAGN